MFCFYWQRSIFPALLLAAGALSGCQQPAESERSASADPTSLATGAGVAVTDWRVEQVVTGLEVPWGIVFLPDGRILLTERAGRIRVVEKERLLPNALSWPDAGKVAATVESGALDIAIHPSFSQNRWVYLVYTYVSPQGLQERVVRYALQGNSLRQPHTIIDGIPAGRIHSGSRLSFGPDGKLYVSTGDAGNQALPQDLDSLAGKVLRVNDDGSQPIDNPFYAGPQATRSRIWSYGHRNPQGLAWQPGSGRLFATEHGPRGGDEVNLIQRGGNYGWPLVSHDERRNGTVAPLLSYTPSIAPAAATFYRGNRLPQFQGNLLVAALRGERLQRIILQGTQAVQQEALLTGRYGRIRIVAEGPDGLIYLATSNCDGRGSCNPRHKDRLLRLVPASATDRLAAALPAGR